MVSQPGASESGSTLSGSGIAAIPSLGIRLVGRERELMELADLLCDPQIALLTLTGTGGTGKTALALEVARRASSEFESGAVLIELASITDSAQVAGEVARNLEIRLSPGETPLDALVRVLSSRRMLLVLDNFEHVIDAAPAVSRLIRGCRQLKVVATSRAPLRIAHEHVYPVAALTYPDPGSRHAPEGLARFPAVALFVERARSRNHGFRLSPDNAAAVADLCAHYEGFAAGARARGGSRGRVRARGDAQRAANVEGVRRAARRDTPARHRTLRAAIDWSYRLLTRGQQSVLVDLGVFVGGFTVAAADAVVSRPEHVVDSLSVLLDHGLIRRNDAHEGQPRFEMLEPIRRYALDRLSETESRERAIKRHAEFFANLAEAAAIGLEGRGQLRWLRTLDEEQANVRAVLYRSEEIGEVELGLRVAGALAEYLRIRDLAPEIRRWLEPVLVRHSATPEIRAKALFALASAACQQDDFEAARAHLDACALLCVELGDLRLSASCATDRAYVEWATLHHDEAVIHARRACELAKDCGTTWTLAAALMLCAFISGDYQEGLRLSGDALRLIRAIGDRLLPARMNSNLGYEAIVHCDLETARKSLQLAVTDARGVLGVRYQAGIASNLGLLELIEGRDLEAAGRYLRLAVTLGAKVGAIATVFEALTGLAGIAIRQDDSERAARLAAAAYALYDGPRLARDELIRERFLVSLPTAILEGRGQEPTPEEVDAVIAEIVAEASGLELFSRNTQIERTTVVLTTLLLTDIVGSTSRAAQVGDTAWLHLLDSQMAACRRAFERCHGTEVKNTGDGLLASFESPADAIRCALKIGEASRELGLEIRAGVHLGECDVLDTDVRGLAVHVVARVCALASGSEVLVTQNVRDLEAGLGIAFAPRGDHELRGLPGRWELFAAEATDASSTAAR